MKKEELVQLHLLLLQFKQFCEEHGIVRECSHYHQLEISPLQVHRSKEEHKRAIFVLVTELVASLTEREQGAAGLRQRHQVTGEATVRAGE
jgi:hypothetical protein